MPSEVKLTLDCMDGNIDFAFEMMADATKDTNSIVGHLHNGRAYLCHQGKDEQHETTND